MRTRVATLLVVCALGVPAVGAAPRARPSSPAPDEKPLGSVPVRELLGRRDAAALGELERRFAAAADNVEKQKIAAVLVRRLEDDRSYFDFLAARAREAVENDMPFPLAVGPDGHFLPRQYAPAFLRWANQKRIFPDQAAAYALNVAPLDVMVLALTDDLRAREIFLRGLESPNYMVVYRAAWGLARLRDRSALAQVVAAAEAAPADGGELIARTLVLFEAPEAQAAAARLIPDPQVLEALRGRARQELEMSIGEGFGAVGRE